MGVALLFLGLLSLVLLGDLFPGPDRAKPSTPSGGTGADIPAQVGDGPSIQALIASLARDATDDEDTARACRPAVPGVVSPSRDTLQQLISEARPLGARRNKWNAALPRGQDGTGSGAAPGTARTPMSDYTGLLDEIVFTPLVLGKKGSERKPPLPPRTHAAKPQGRVKARRGNDAEQAPDAVPTEIEDFVTDQDVLRILLPPETAQADPDIVFAPSENGVDGVVTVNGDVIAILRGAAGASGIDVFVDVLERRHA